MSWNTKLQANITHPVQYESGTSLVQVGCEVHASKSSGFCTGEGGTNTKYPPVNEALFLPIYQVKMASSLWQATKMNELGNIIVNV